MKVVLQTVSFPVSESSLMYGESNSPEAATEIARIILEKMDAGQEHVLLLVVNAANKVIGFKVISSGGVEEANCDMKILFRSALTMGSGGSGLIIAHNHPSGETTPSSQDNALTKRVKDCAEVLGYRFLDHLIIGGPGNSYSYRDRGRLR